MTLFRFTLHVCPNQKSTKKAVFRRLLTIFSIKGENLNYQISNIWMALIETFSNISCLSLWIINIYYSCIFWNQFCFMHNITLFYFRYAKAPETDFRRYRYFVRVCPRLTNQTFLQVSTNANFNIFKIKLWKKLGV